MIRDRHSLCVFLENTLNMSITNHSKHVYDQEVIMRRFFKYVGLMCSDYPFGKRFRFLPFISVSLLVGGTIVILVHGLLLEYHTPNSNWMPSTTAVAVTACHYGCLGIACVFTIVMAGIKYRNMAKMYSYIDSVKKNLPIEVFSPRICLLILSSLIFYLIFFVLDFLTCSRVNSLYIWYSPNFLYELICWSLLVQCSLIAHRLKQLFIALNIEISKALSSHRKECFVEPSRELIETISISSLAMFKPDRRRLQSLCDIHWILCKAIQQFNDVFGVQLALHCLTILVHLIDSPYYIFLAFTDSTSENDDVYYSIDIIIRALIRYAQLAAIVIPCGQTSAKANDTKYTIAKYISSEAPEEIKSEAKTFLLVLNQHPTAFSAFGLFFLDAGVITSVTAAVTTYLVILLQFQTQV